MRSQASDRRYQLADRNGEDHDIAASDGYYVADPDIAAKSGGDLRSNRVTYQER
jgi:hypothetical protein